MHTLANEEFPNLCAWLASQPLPETRRVLVLEAAEVAFWLAAAVQGIRLLLL